MRERERGVWSSLRSLGPAWCLSPWSEDLKHLQVTGVPHVLSLRMMVASMRKNVFQPSVTAKPRHTIIRDRPHPEEHHKHSRFSLLWPSGQFSLTSWYVIISHFIFKPVYWNRRSKVFPMLGEALDERWVRSERFYFDIFFSVEHKIYQQIVLHNH